MGTELNSLVKRKQKLFDGKTILILCVLIMSFGIMVFLILTRNPSQNGTSASPYWTWEKQFKYANTLLSKGLKRQALTEYEECFEMGEALPDDRAKVAYQMGDIYMELGEYEKALASFYRVDMETPDSEISSQTDAKVVECLERLGMTEQARYELESRTTIGKNKQKEDVTGLGPVIARIDDEEVHMSEITHALNQMPDWMKKQYESDEARLDFVRQYLATELLYRKAKRLGHEDDPDVRVKVRDVIKQVLVQKMLMDEIGKIIVDPRDVKLYYDAYKDRYAEKARYKLSMIQFESREKAENILNKLKSGGDFKELARTESTHEQTKANGGEIKVPVVRGAYITDSIGNSPRAWEAIDKISKGVTDVVEINNQYYIFLVHDKTPERQRSFSEVKDMVESDYSRERQEQAMQDLLNRTLEEREVEIYTDSILKFD
ncbi:hypothetical protein GF312_16725 [Candidatus Poribacteria bacterium]|nr:hypothetical protein [Candidatus Poribacteria bacterium]